MLPKNFWGSDLLKSPDTGISLFILAFLKFSRETYKSYEKGTWPKSLIKWGHMPHMPPGSYVHASNYKKLAFNAKYDIFEFLISFSGDEGHLYVLCKTNVVVHYLANQK